MKCPRIVCSICSLLGLASGLAWSADPPQTQVPHLYAPYHHGQSYQLPSECLPVPGTPVPRPGETAPSPEPTAADAFAQAPEAGTQGASNFSPGMFGDLLGPRIVVQLPNGSTVNAVVATAPSVALGAFKIAEGESPRPVDRVFVLYNYYSNVLGPIVGPGIPNSNVNREIIGFEKTFLDRNASFGIRLPFFQVTGFDAVEDSFIGDLTFILKFALINNPDTLNVLSGGLVVTAPTGENSFLFGDLNSTLIQPWGGFIYNWGSLYAHGFSSILIPTDSRDTTLWFNDLGIGWWMYRNNCCRSFLSAIVPTGEVHVNTPLNNRNSTDSAIGFFDTVDLTGGIYWVFGQRTVLGTAVGVPVSGPKPYDIEALCSLNFRF